MKNKFKIIVVFQNKHNYKFNAKTYPNTGPYSLHISGPRYPSPCIKYNNYFAHGFNNSSLRYVLFCVFRIVMVSFV